jgi:hypothetical protein
MSLETIDIDIDEPHEFLFKVVVEGTDPSPSKVRLVCESNDLSFLVMGRQTDVRDVLQFNMPSMKGRLQEGTYRARIEVLVENRYFAPVEFDVNLKKKVRVVAEAVMPIKKPVPEISVTATSVNPIKPVQRSVSHVESVRQIAKTVIQKHEQTFRSLQEHDSHPQISELNEDQIIATAQSFIRSQQKKR